MQNASPEVLSQNVKNYLPSPTLSELNARLDSQNRRWHERENCPACNSVSLRHFAVIRRISYARCRTCGFVFTNPAPPEEIISEFYNSTFYNNYRRLEEDRIRNQPYFSVSAYTDLRRLAGWLNGDKSASILDFGCGPGSFLALIRDEFGFKNIEGLELNKESAGIALRNYGLDIANNIKELKRKQYDFIILFEVIEHLTNPDEVISICTHLLKDGGSLFVTTPSVRNIPARMFASHCGHYTGPSHVSLFTEEALSRLLGRFGLNIVRLETDKCMNVLGNYIAKPFYEMDFASPRSSADGNDALFVPTRVGRALGLKPTRSVGRFLQAAYGLDRLVGRCLAKIARLSYSDHLYVMARKGD
jgi:2-polyprenyl-3-methyl-5-hydroxy-6-metoxy-1,4-benzoquinol methylase